MALLADSCWLGALCFLIMHALSVYFLNKSLSAKTSLLPQILNYYHHCNLFLLLDFDFPVTCEAWIALELGLALPDQD